MPTFGRRLKALRESRGWDMREARRQTGFAMSHLQYLEREGPPGPATLKRLSERFGVPIDELATEEERREAEAHWQATLDHLLSPESDLSDEDKEYFRRRYRPSEDDQPPDP